MVATALLAAASLATSNALATPTRWAVARDSKLQQDEALARAAERELILDQKEKHSPFEDSILRIESHAPKAAILLERGDAKSSGDWYVRLLLARAYFESKRWEDSMRAFEGMLTFTHVPEIFRADALRSLAVAYSWVERNSLAVEAYEVAIALEPHTSSRALMLANQAESFMAMGDVSRAVLGYRASLESLSMSEAYFLAPTSLWSLGVALDRSGDFNAAMESIGRARSYDPKDIRITGSDWSFIPPNDENYYRALGEWHLARQATEVDTRLAAYERSSIAWKQYLSRAPTTNPYVPMARIRLRALDKEFDDFATRARTPTPIDPRKPALESE